MELGVSEILKARCKRNFKEMNEKTLFMQGNARIWNGSFYSIVQFWTDAKSLNFRFPAL
jgi:hypothetical protein